MNDPFANDTPSEESVENIEPSKTSNPLDELSTTAIFDYLEKRINDEVAHRFILLAHQEYTALVEKTSVEEARLQVGSLVAAAIRARLNVARGHA